MATTLDVCVERPIPRSPSEVAAYATDPANDPVWISGISEARLLTEMPIGEGTRVARVARFRGRRIDYVLEVTDHVPERRLAMRSIEAPFPMRVAYEFEPSDRGTLARIRVGGEPSRIYGLFGPLMRAAVRRNLRRDLRNLERELT
jgi:hypothetical protein